MNWIFKKLIKFFFKYYFKIRPPKTVKYYKTQDAARAKVVHADDGSLQMQIEGEDMIFPGFPRGHVLTGPLAKVKHSLKNMVFNQVFEELEKNVKDYGADMMPPEKMVPAVREFHRVLEELENAEVTDDMKGRIRLIRKVLCFFLQEDDAYRFRLQWVLERINMKKMKLSDADKYYFRAKYFKVDHDIFDY